MIPTVINERIRLAFIKTGRLSFEMAVRMGEEYLPKLMAEYGGTFHLTGITGGWDGAQMAARSLLSQGLPITTIIYTVDTYHFRTDSWEEAEAVAGTLQERFAAGDPKVTEALQVMIHTPDDKELVVLPYRRGSGNTVVWRPQGEKIWKGEQVTGRYADLWQHVITQSLAKT